MFLVVALLLHRGWAARQCRSQPSTAPLTCLRLARHRYVLLHIGKIAFPFDTCGASKETKQQTSISSITVIVVLNINSTPFMETKACCVPEAFQGRVACGSVSKDDFSVRDTNR